MKNFSIITDFGCPFDCSFCVTKSQKTRKTFSFEESLFDELSKQTIGYERISVSGGGEPLFVHNEDIKSFYEGLFIFSKKMNIPIHVHTNLMHPNDLASQFDKVAISVTFDNFKKKLFHWSKLKVSKRFVYVSNGSDLENIQDMIFQKEEHEEKTGEKVQFTIKQLEEIPLSMFKGIESFSKTKEGVMFLPTGDYNTYFFLNDKNIYNVFSEIKFK